MSTSKFYPEGDGRFGSKPGPSFRTPKRRRKSIFSPSPAKHFSAGGISAERWVDIVCIPLISIFLIFLFLNWNAILDIMFVYILFPVITFFARLLLIVAGVGSVIGFLYARIVRPHRW